jgi:tRNA(Ile)-lysidine synthase
VALSGGGDSTALCHATARALRGSGIELAALHVHNGLMPQADGWLRHLRRQIGRWAAGGLPVRLVWTRLQGKPAPGDSVEAWARRERYVALARMARDAGAGVVLRAQHRRDQAETFLLQALRAAGPAGLAAMPREVERDGIVWSRPWLDQPRESIEAYLRRHRLSVVDDASNRDARLARAKLRTRVWPALAGAFEDAESCLAGSARRAQEARACLHELAAIDLATITEGGALVVARWQALSAPRRANALRAWLARHKGDGVPETLVQRLLLELPLARAAQWPLGVGQLRCFDGLLSHASAAAARAPASPAPQCIDLSKPGLHAVPGWHGAFEVRRQPGGLHPHDLRQCTLCERRGGERFQCAPNALPRSLKKQFQAARVPAWQREGPLVFAGERLLFVPGLGADARQWVAADAPALMLYWHHDPG